MSHVWQRGEYAISTDPARLDLQLIHEFLSASSYWAQGRSFETVRRSVEHSLPFGVYRGQEPLFGEVGGVGEAGGLADDDPDARAAIAARRELLDPAVVEGGGRAAAVLDEHLGEVAPRAE